MSETTQSSDSPKTPTSEATAEGLTQTGADTAAGSGTEHEDEETRRATAKEWLAQLEHMIESLATQATPAIRQVGAKAAELAALAAEKAGPIAHRAAELTEVAGTKVAERSRHLAEGLRRERQDEASQEPEGVGSEGEAAGTGEGTAAEGGERSA